MHADRVAGVINLSVPFMQRGETPWVDFWEQALGGDFYIVHFNRQPGVADAAFLENTENFLRNLYRTDQWRHEPVDLGPGMPMISMARADTLPGELMMSEEDLSVFVDSFRSSGFTGGINWYRNFDRNWATAPEVGVAKIELPALMISAEWDMALPPALVEGMRPLVPDLEEHVIPRCGHWTQQEAPEALNRLLIDWLGRRLR